MLKKYLSIFCITLLTLIFITCSSDEFGIKRVEQSDVIKIDDHEIDLIADNKLVRVDGWFLENDEKLNFFLGIKGDIYAIYANSEQGWLRLQKRLNENKRDILRVASTDSFYFVSALKGNSFFEADAEEIMEKLLSNLEKLAKEADINLEFVEKTPLTHIIIASNKKKSEMQSVQIYTSLIVNGKVISIYNIRGQLLDSEKQEIIDNYKIWIKEIIDKNKKP